MGIVASQLDDEDLLRPEEFEELESMSGFDRDDLIKLYKRFKSLDRSSEGTLSEDDLLRVPEVAMNPLVDRVLGYFGFGPHAVALCGKSVTRVNFTDFVKALSLFNQARSKEEKLDRVFASFDIDGDGVLSNQEFVSLIRSLVGKSMDQNDIEELVNYALNEADETKEGLTKEEFRRILLPNTFIDKNSTRTRSESSSLEAFHRKREKELKLKS